MARLVNEGLTTEQTAKLAEFARGVFGKEVKHLAFSRYLNTAPKKDENDDYVRDDDGNKIYEQTGEVDVTGLVGYNAKGKVISFDCDAPFFSALAEIAYDDTALEDAGFSYWNGRDQVRQWLRDLPLNASDYENNNRYLRLWLAKTYGHLLPLDDSRDAVYIVA